MALREEIILDLQSAFAELDRLDQRLRQPVAPIKVSVDVEGESATRSIAESLERAADAANAFQRELGATSATASGLDDEFRLISSALGLSEADAREMARQLGVAQIQSTQLDDAIRSVGSAMGLSEREAAQLARQMQRVEQETEDASREAQTLGQRFSSVRQSIGPLVATLAAGLGVREVIQQFGSAIRSATALAESVNAVRVVFDEGADSVLAFGERAAQAAGLATSEFQQLVVPIGALLQNFGLEGQTAADAALELTQRAADLASLMNVEVADALQAIGASLRGEQEPIRALGVSFDEAAVNAKALELGLGGINGELGTAEKGQARLALLLEQSSFAAGDFANTADEAANRTRTLTAEFENVRAEIGEALLKVFERLLDAAPDLGDALLEAAPAIAEVAGAFADLAIRAAEALGPVSRFLSDTARDVGFLDEDVFVSFTEGLEGVNAAVANIDRGLGLELSGIADAFGVAGARGVRAAEDFREFLEISQDLVDALREGADPAGAFLDAFEEMNEKVPVTAEALGSLVQTAGLTDDELRNVLGALVAAGPTLGLTAAEVRVLRDAFNELFDAADRGTGLNFARGGRSAAEDVAAIVGEFSQIEADRVLRDTFGDLPIVVSDIESLERALARAGVTLTDFLSGDTGDLEIVGVFDRAETQALELRAVLLELSLIDPVAGFIGAADIVSEETGKIITDLDELKANLLEQATAQAEFEANLAEIIRTIGPNVASLVAESGPDAALLAQALVGDPALGAEIEAILAGQLGPAGEAAAASLAETLATATPQQLAAIGAFAADNFLSPAVVQQILATGGEIAALLEQGLSGYTIAPELIIELTNAQISGVINTGTIPIGDGFGDTPGSPLPVSTPAVSEPPVADRLVVNINNATTESVETSATQAGQTIQAVADSLVQVR